MSHSDYFIDYNLEPEKPVIGPSASEVVKHTSMEVSPTSEDHFDNWIDDYDSRGRRRHMARWDRVKREAAERHYELVNLYRVAVDSHKLRGDLKTAIMKTNEWLEKNSLVGYPTSPVDIFINFFKKEVRQDRTIDKAIRGNSVNLNYSKGYVSGMSFYDTYWPTYAMGFYRDLSAAVKEIDFESLRSMKTDSTVVEIGTSIKEAMAPGLSKLLNYTF